MRKQTAKKVERVQTASSMDVKPKSQKKQQPEEQLDRHELIARQAYLIAEQRGFQGGDAVADWLQAEAMIDLESDVSH